MNMHLVLGDKDKRFIPYRSSFDLSVFADLERLQLELLRIQDDYNVEVSIRRSLKISKPLFSYTKSQSSKLTAYYNKSIV